MSQLIRFECPQCHKTFSTEPKQAGRSMKCPGCSRFVKVPAFAGDTLDTKDVLLKRDASANTTPTNAKAVPSAKNAARGEPIREPETESFETDFASAIESESDWALDLATLPKKKKPKTAERERVRTRSSERNTGRVFENYVTVTYLRVLWKIAIFVSVIAWLVFVGGQVVVLSEQLNGELNAELDLARAVGGALGAIVAFTFIDVLCLLLVRISLETVAVFFDIAEDMRRLADSNENA